MEYTTLFGRKCLVLCLVNVVFVCAQSEGDVRLIDGYSNSNQGRVEVFHDGTWGTVCGKDWGSEEATVVCRQLDLDEVLLSKAFFGNGSGPIYVGAHCHDHDFHITECHGSWEEVPTTCTHEEDVAVICYPENHEEASTGLTFWYEMIIVVAIGIFCYLVLKVVTFLEDSKVEVEEDEAALHEVRTDDHPYAASKYVSTSDEGDITSRKNDVSESKHDVTANENEVNKKEVDMNNNENDVNNNKNDVNKRDNVEVDERQLSVDTPNVVQTVDVSVQTLN